MNKPIAPTDQQATAPATTFASIPLPLGGGPHLLVAAICLDGEVVRTRLFLGERQRGDWAVAVLRGGA